MTIFDGSNGGTPLIRPYPDESTVHFTEETIVVSSESVSVNSVDDANIATHTSAVTENRVSVSVFNAPIHSIQCTSNGQVSGSVVSRVNDGEATITVRMPHIKKGYQVEFARTSPVSYDAFSSWVTGSLAGHCADQVDSRVFNMSESDVALRMPQFTTRNTAAGVYVRNTECWASDLNLTAIPANAPGVAITPRHVLTVTHHTGSGVIHFADEMGETVTRSRSATTAVPGIYDLSIVTLDSDLPEEITPASIVPSTIDEYLPGIQWGVPVLASNQYRDCIIKDALAMPGSVANLDESSVASRLIWEKDIIVGDSGSPIFLVINGTAALLALWGYSGGASGGGPAPHNVISAINAITTLTGHTVQTVDLSGFTNYA